jgi:soluble lytic murein transglycosylase
LHIFLAILVLFLSLGSSGRAQSLNDADLKGVRTVVAAARAGDWAQAYAAAAQIKDPVPGKMLRWLDYLRGSPAGRFAEIADFIDHNADWPSQIHLRQRAEEATASEPDAIVEDWFKRHPPITGMGKVRAAELTINTGDVAGGTAALRTAWIEGDFTPTGEIGFLSRFSATIRPEDNAKRLDRLIWDGQSEAARRMLPLVGPDTRALGEARLALAAQAPAADGAVGRVPAALRGDPGLVYEQLRWRRKKDMIDAAAQLLVAQQGDLVRPEAWWTERQMVARRILAGGDADLAYKVVQQHGLIEGNSFSEAEFLSGYIALRFAKKPALAFEHFSRILTRVSTPYAKARAGYWGGRAAEMQGKSELAAKWYAAGADYMTTFYGQLAAHQLGNDAPPKPVPEPVPTPAELAAFKARDLVRATQILFDVGERDNAKAFLLRLTELATTPVEFAMLAGLAEARGRIDLAIAVAKRSLQAGVPLMIHGYPVTALPTGGTTEHSLLFAIMRQESAFEREAVSRAGARGLMQLMPATANYIANKMQLPFTLQRLTDDGIYNVLLGRAYLETLIDDFGGSYALAIAAYNAGPGRIRQWLRDYGDPRGRDVDMVDWIEIIPFAETRGYVQRVLENLQIYRVQDRGRNAAAFSLAGDLAR